MSTPAKHTFNGVIISALCASMCACVASESTGTTPGGNASNDTALSGNDSGVADSGTADAGSGGDQQDTATSDAGSTGEDSGSAGTQDGGGQGPVLADASAGVDSTSGGPVDAGGGAKTCQSHTDCPAGTYCKADTCGAAGVCANKPQICPTIYAPVCGCDDKTYSSDCNAAGNGVNVKSKGKCGGGGGGGTITACTVGATGPKSQCKPSEYCEAPKGVGCTGAGTCKAIPKICPVFVKPEYVCGCDGKTYGAGICDAAKNGFNIKSKGKCAGSGGGGTITACTVGATGTKSKCKATEYCAAAKPWVCTGKGTCKAKPKTCPPSLVGAKVCGCDAKNYSSTCMAARNGQNTKSKGACSGSGGATACTIGVTGTKSKCKATEYCKAAKGGVCSGTGTCTKKGPTCPPPLPTTSMQVCGCNGKTYTNSCLTSQYGVNIKSKGACSGSGGATACTIGVTGTKSKCKATEYCAATKPGACSGKGSCKTKPQMCTMQFDPTCGCDGKTYGNSCSAASKGVNVKSKGTCSSGGGNTPTKCKAVKAGSLGMCKMIVGYAVNAAGTACTSVGGCGCKHQSVDYCDAIYKTKSDCEASCLKGVGPGGGTCKSGSFKPYNGKSAVPITCDNIRKHGNEAIMSIVKKGSACTKDSDCKAVWSSTKCGPLCSVGINSKSEAELKKMMTWVETNICKLCKNCNFPVAGCLPPKPGCKLDNLGQGTCVSFK